MALKTFASALKIELLRKKNYILDIFILILNEMEHAKIRRNKKLNNRSVEN